MGIKIKYGAILMPEIAERVFLHLFYLNHLITLEKTISKIKALGDIGFHYLMK
jgi:hypothetical protein